MSEKIVYALFSAKWGWLLDREGENRFTTTDRTEVEKQIWLSNIEGEYWRVYWWLECQEEMQDMDKPKPYLAIFLERWAIRIRSSLIYPWWKRCDNICGWAWPYGYVPEAGCPVHNPDR